MTQIQEVSKCYWKNGAARLAWHRVATNLPFVKKKKERKKKHYLWSIIKWGMPVIDCWGWGGQGSLISFWFCYEKLIEQRVVIPVGVKIILTFWSPLQPFPWYSQLHFFQILVASVTDTAEQIPLGSLLDCKLSKGCWTSETQLVWFSDLGSWKLMSTWNPACRCS